MVTGLNGGQLCTAFYQKLIYSEEVPKCPHLNLKIYSTIVVILHKITQMCFWLGWL